MENILLHDVKVFRPKNNITINPNNNLSFSFDGEIVNLKDYDGFMIFNEKFLILGRCALDYDVLILTDEIRDFFATHKEVVGKYIEEKMTKQMISSAVYRETSYLGFPVKTEYFVFANKYTKPSVSRRILILVDDDLASEECVSETLQNLNVIKRFKGLSLREGFMSVSSLTYGNFIKNINNEINKKVDEVDGIVWNF